jgi:predicted protein tyrosine phosphatase
MNAELRFLSDRILACDEERSLALVVFNDVSPTDDASYWAAREAYWQANSAHMSALQAFADAWRRSENLPVPERVPMRAKPLSNGVRHAR